MKKLTLGISFVASLITGCATTGADGEKIGLLEDMGSGVAIAMTEAHAYEGPHEAKTVASGEVMMSQSFGITQAAKLSEPVKEATLPLFGIKYDISPEVILYPVKTLKYGNLYCMRDVGKSSLVGSLLTGESQHRGCLRDKDGDNKFDQLWGTDEAVANATYSSIWTQRASGVDLKTPVAYEIIDGANLPMDTLVVQFKTLNPIFSSKEINFYLAALNEKGKIIQSSTTSNSYKIKNLTLPMTILIDGAQIEILAYDDEAGTVEYRVKSGFPEGLPVMLPSARAPQVTYVYY